MEYENDEWEISLKDIFFYVLLRWKKILAVALACAILLGGVCFGKLLLEMNNEDEEEKDVAKTAEERYAYDIQLIEQKIEEQEALIANHYDYMRDSILMQLDPLNTYCTEISIYLSTGYQIMPDMVYQNPDYTDALLRYYKNLLNDVSTLDVIAEEIGTKAEYLREVLTIDQSGNWLDILVLHYNSETVEKISEMLVDTLQASQNKAAKSIGEHTIDIMQHTIVKYIGEGIVENQERARGHISTLQEELELTKSKLRTLELPKSSTDSSAVNCIKMFIVGFSVGAIGTIICLGVCFAFSDKVHSDEELERRLGIKVLGKATYGEKKKDPISQFVGNLANRHQKNSRENYSLIAQRVDYCVEENETIALTDYINSEISNNLVDELNKFGLRKFVTIGSVLNDPVALSTLKDQKNIILIVRTDYSKYRMLSKELIQLKDAGCNHVGCIVVE